MFRYGLSLTNSSFEPVKPHEYFIELNIHSFQLVFDVCKVVLDVCESIFHTCESVFN